MVPSGSDEPDPSKLHVSPLQAEVNEATGGALTALTLFCPMPVAPPLSVTVSVARVGAGGRVRMTHRRP